MISLTTELHGDINSSPSPHILAEIIIIFSCPPPKKKKILPTTADTCQCTFNETRSSADADNGLDAFVGQSRSTNILDPFQVK